MHRLRKQGCHSCLLDLYLGKIKASVKFHEYNTCGSGVMAKDQYDYRWTYRVIIWHTDTPYP